MQHSTSPLWVITGPTGVGKTEAAMRIADHFPVDLISADSVMVYRDLNIGSAKPSKDELARYPHALVDHIDPEIPFDAGRFVSAATAAIHQSWEHQRIPVLVGGTILYLRALLYGLDRLPAASVEVRAAIRDEARTHGWARLHAELEAHDPILGQEIHPHHSSRIERAVEVLRLTGSSIRSFWSGPSLSSETFGQACRPEMLILWPEDRDALRERLASRFDAMLAVGFLDEVQQLMQRGSLTHEHPSMRSVGYRQAWQYLQGDSDFETMRGTAIMATRQLAKRQLTWLRREQNAHQLLVGSTLNSQAVLNWAASLR
jgi:tRNA dimethylallyltransferase